MRSKTKGILADVAAFAVVGALLAIFFWRFYRDDRLIEATERMGIWATYWLVGCLGVMAVIGLISLLRRRNRNDRP